MLKVWLALFALFAWCFFNAFLRCALLNSRRKGLADLVTVVSVQKVIFLTVKRAQPKEPPAPQVLSLTPLQKQARVNKLLKNFIDGGINLPNAEKMLKIYEQQNLVWRIENAEFSNLVKVYGNQLSYATQASLFLLWRKHEFQNLIKLYVS